MRLPVFCSMLLLAALATESMLNAAGSEAVRSTPAATGFAAKRPVFGGACRTCPWGAIADFVKAALQPYGYDVLICYTCAGGPVEARLVAGAKMPPPYREMPAGIDIARSLYPLHRMARSISELPARSTFGMPTGESTTSPRTRKVRARTCG